MNSIKFEKWQGIGNDFVIVSEGEFPGRDVFSKWATKICDRRYGVGGDGLVWVGKSEKEDFQMIICNSDGSVADMCGNALRCAVAYAYQKGIAQKSEMTIETDAGTKTGQVHLEGHTITGVTINMGKPIWDPKKIPMDSDQVKNVPVEAAGQVFNITALNTGVPHAVAFVDSFDGWDWLPAGEALMQHPIFPAKTNMNFIQVVDRKNLIMRVWERGAGPTLACGTGACASVVAAAENGLTDREVDIVLEGGTLSIKWDEEDYIWMTGPAEKSFSGQVAIN